MKDYTKNDFYHYFDKDQNIRRYYIKVHGTFIEVSKDVYHICYNSYRKQLRDNKKDHEYGLISYDSLLPDGHTVIDTYGKDYDYLECIYRKDLMKAIMKLIYALDDKDKELIREWLFENKNENELAKRFQVTQQTINKRKKKIIKALQEKLSDGYKKIKFFMFFWWYF